MEIITSSRLKAFHSCQRLHHLSYNLGYRSLATKEMLAFGTLLHKGLEAWWRAHQQGESAAEASMAAVSENAGDIDLATLAKVELMMTAYDLRWSESMGDYQVLAVEAQFECGLFRPDGSRVRGMRRAGKIDAIVRRLSDSAKLTVEHKGTSASLSPSSNYWQHLRMDSQVSFYFDGAASLGHDIQGCIYDVIARPDQRPLKATPVELRKYTKATTKEPSRLYANQRETDETIEEFKDRMAAMIAEKPDDYFARAEVVRLDSELEAARRDIYEGATLIRQAKRTGVAPRHADACLRMYGGICSFYEVCSGTADIDDPYRFKKVDDVHPELVDASR